MDWIILFIVSWVLFFICVDYKTLSLSQNILCGFLAVILQLLIDSYAINTNLYKVGNVVIDVFGSSLFFVLGPVFVIGTLLSQYHPKSTIKRFFHIVIVSTLFSVTEYLLILRDDLEYINWNHPQSVFVNISVISMLSWFSMAILKRRV